MVSEPKTMLDRITKIIERKTSIPTPCIHYLKSKGEELLFKVINNANVVKPNFCPSYLKPENNLKLQIHMFCY